MCTKVYEHVRAHVHVYSNDCAHGLPRFHTHVSRGLRTHPRTCLHPCLWRIPIYVSLRRSGRTGLHWHGKRRLARQGSSSRRRHVHVDPHFYAHPCTCPYTHASGNQQCMKDVGGGIRSHELWGVGAAEPGTRVVGLSVGPQHHRRCTPQEHAEAERRRRVCRHVCGHVCGHVCRHVCSHACPGACRGRAPAKQLASEGAGGSPRRARRNQGTRCNARTHARMRAQGHAHGATCLTDRPRGDRSAIIMIMTNMQMTNMLPAPRRPFGHNNDNDEYADD